MLVGFLWYSPLPFRKPWMKEMDYDPNGTAKTREMKIRGARPAYAGSLAASLTSACVLALFLHRMRAEGAHIEAMTGCF